MNSLQLLLFILCVVDLYKNRKILSPSFLFNFIFFVTYSLYEWDFSYIQQKLSSRTELILFNCVVFYNLAFYALNKCVNLYKKNDKPLNRIASNKKIQIAKYIAIAVFIIELIYSRGCPLIWKFVGDTRTYFDFGIPSLNGAFYGLIICLGAYSLFTKSKDKYLYLAMGILMISRQVIMSIFIEGIIYFIISNKGKINYLKIVVLIIIAFVGFTIVGNFRSGNDTMNSVFMPKAQYKKLPDSVKWTYSYMTFSVSNLNNLVNMTEGNVNKGTSMLSELLPTVLLDKVNLKPEFTNYYLVSPTYNVSTYLPSIYVDFGILGVAIFNALMALIGYLLYSNVVHRFDEKSILMYSVFAHNIILLFFINMFLYLPIIIQLVYIPLIFGNKKKNKEKEKNSNKKSSLAILLATYNGEKYLKEQLDSILNQTYKDFTLYIRDDGSKDKTVQIIKEYTKKYDNIIQVIDKRESHGSCDNFLNLLKYAYELDKYDIFMFADQDDVWLPNKVEITVNEYKKHNEDIPQLVHTDLYVVDKNLKIMNKSFIKYSNLDSNCKSFNKYLIQNNVTGCTMLINKKLVDLVNFDIKNVRMHDWYFALLASSFGQVHFINKPTIKYRQHGNNVLGAKKVKGIRGVYNKLVKNNTIKNDLNKIFVQAEIFKDNYYEQLSDENKDILDSFCQMYGANKVKKLLILNQYKFYKQGKIRVIGELVFI